MASPCCRQRCTFGCFASSCFSRRMRPSTIPVTHADRDRPHPPWVASTPGETPMPRTLHRSCYSCGLLAVVALISGASRTEADEPKPPKGFTALFNGKDLACWHGMPHFDPYKLAAMPEAERKAQLEKWTEDARKHWTVENGELVNDGNGAYLTTDKDYGDIELLIEYKTVPKADSGIYLRATPQVQIWDYTKEGGKWNLFRILMVGERVTVYLNDKLVVDHARLENFWNRKAALTRQWPIQLQTHG